MNGKELRAITGAFILVAFTAPASAAIVDLTIESEIYYGVDNDGLFGIAGTDLTGSAMTMSYIFDTNKGVQVRSADLSTTYGYGANTPALGAVVTINGHQQTATGSYYGSLQSGTFTSVNANVSNQLAYDQIDAPSSSNPNQYYAKYFYSHVYSSTFGIPTADNKAFTYILSSRDRESSLSEVGFGFIQTADTAYDFSTRLFARPSLVDETVLIPDLVDPPFTPIPPVVAAVPEPQTWLMMLLGLAGIGLMAHNRLRKAVGSFAA